MRALVTGGCGFVGRHLTRRLLGLGYDVTVVDNLSSGIHPASWPKPPLHGPVGEMEFIYDDIRSFIKRTAADSFDFVFHLAAVVGGRLKIEGDPLAVATDLAIDADFFNWLAKHGYQGKAIYFSSSAVYPVIWQNRAILIALSEQDIDFTDVLNWPDMTYGWSKLSGEYLAKYAVENYDIDVVIYRPFSGYGEDQSFDYPFPSIIRRVVNGEDPVVVWGSGDQARDFIYIEDVIDCVFATMDKLKPGEALNIGSGFPTTFKKLAYLAGAKNVVNDPSKPEGVFSRVADTTKMRKWYEPTTTLEEGIAIVKKALTANTPSVSKVD